MKKLILFGIFLLISLYSVQAANCGGAIQCNCGDTVVENATLDHDLNCPGYDWGLLIDTNNIRLNCNNHIIEGTINPNSKGIKNNGNNIIIENCIMKEWEKGIYLQSNSYDVTITKNTVYSNTIGIGLYESDNNQLIENLVFDNSNIGIYLDDRSNLNSIWNNFIENNGIYNALERVTSINNEWDNGNIGNYWSDFLSNPGYPNYYEIDGDGDGIDHYPNQELEPPELDPIGNQTIMEGENLYLDVNATDPNYDELTYYIDTNITSYYEFNQETGALNWTPTYHDAGIYYANFSVTDGLFWDSEQITITVEDNESINVDFEITSEGIIFSNQTPLRNTTVTITAIFENLGSEDPDEVLVRFYSDEPSNETIIGEDLVIIRSPLTSTFFAQTEWTPEIDGNYSIYVWIDPENEIPELNEDNNIAYNTLFVKTKPDLRIRDENIGFTNNYPQHGEEIQILVMIRNIENEAARNFTVRVYDGEWDNLIGETTLTLSGQQTEVIMVPWTATQGDHNIHVWADSTFIVDEWNEDNNHGQKHIYVRRLPWHHYLKNMIQQT